MNRLRTRIDLVKEGEVAIEDAERSRHDQEDLDLLKKYDHRLRVLESLEKQLKT